VVGRDHVIEHAQTESLLRFEQPVEITASITRKLEQKLSLMAAVGNVPKSNEAGSDDWRAASFVLSGTFSN